MKKNQLAALSISLLHDEHGINSDAYHVLHEILMSNGMNIFARKAKAVEDRYVYPENPEFEYDFGDSEADIAKSQVLRLARHLFDDEEGINPESYELFHDELSVHDDLNIQDNLESQDGRFFISEGFFDSI